MTTQVQVRGAIQATQEARTLAVRELDINTTDKRLCVSDGATAGGSPHATWADTQNQEWTYAAATGTNSVAVTMAKAPAAYAAGQHFVFKAQNTNTASATLNVNALGAKTIKRVIAGALATLLAGDIVQNAIYEVTYDGTDMLLMSAGSPSDWTYSGPVTISGSSQTIFTGVPVGVKDVELLFTNFSRSASSWVMLLLGDSGGLETNNYVSSMLDFEAAGAVTDSGAAGFPISSTTASKPQSGIIRLIKDNSTNEWRMSGILSGNTTVVMTSGSKTTSSDLTQLGLQKQGAGTMSGTVSMRYK